MKIYDREGFPTPIRVRAVVAAKGLESQIEWVSVDLIAAEHKQPPFLAKNPSGVAMPRLPLLARPRRGYINGLSGTGPQLSTW